MQLLSQAFIGLIIAVTGLKLYLSYRQINAIKNKINQVPENFNHSITLAEHQKSGQYNLAKLNLGIMENIFSSLVLLAFTIGGGIELINQMVSGFALNSLTQGVAVIVAYTLINALLSLPFSFYSIFEVEQKFGFNNTTVGLFIADLFKSLLLSAVFGIPLVYLILWLMETMGNYWWLWVWVVLVGFNLLVLIIYPSFIAPLFNKFTLLEDAELKQRIESLLTKCGFQSRGIFIMDGSKRSSHSNAYFTGIGTAKRIVFFDTLIKQLNPDELEAILAHELGHFKHKHIVKQMLISFALTLVTLFGLSLLLDQPIFYQALGVSQISHYNGLILFMLLIGVFMFLFAPLASYFSRKNEFEADDFAKQHSNKDSLISGLVKLYRSNAGTLTPDPLYVAFYYSHPPASTRIANLERVG
jgi:STE24 endopeptidase